MTETKRAAVTAPKGLNGISGILAIRAGAKRMQIVSEC